MSQPTTNPKKRSSPFLSTNPSSSSSSSPTTVSGRTPAYSSMKKAKSQAVACSIENKNGQHVHFSSEIDNLDDPSGNSAMMEDSNTDATSRSSVGGGVTANLSRKKATLPQPAKKLVIKLVKGLISTW
ncbi:Cullin-4 [Datura stramonium]|uniref:Cullin-4 n=1 Tax=Datura stramonium TaxID=4076 RepID=A0ABS8SRT4_DATST|nr:Cullin-4 [Datura stramonium]